MANRAVLLCLVLSISLTWYTDNVAGSPKRGWSSGRSSSTSWSKPSYKPSSSSSSWSSWSKPSYPSSSSGHSGYGSSKPSYPSSSSGLSGYGGSSKPSYPSSSTGLSGSGSSWSSWGSKPSYPSSGSGLSGYGSGSSKPSYPSSGSGLSGYGSGSSKPSYPSSGSGLSGYGSGSSKPSYPSSNSGLSGSGSNSGSSWWSSNTNSASYPSSSGGLSGSGTRPSYGSGLPAGVEYTNNKYGHHPSYTSNKYGNNYATPHGTHVVNNHITHVYHPPYYSAPQYVYVNEYRNSGSRYGDILTGLALYNMGRSHSHYHDHYYRDDYYARRYNSGGSMNGNYAQQNDAVCTMKITENGRVEVLKIPCEIVSTFTKEGKQVTIPQSQVNTTICVTNTAVLNSTAPVNVNSDNSTLSANSTLTANSTLSAKSTLSENSTLSAKSTLASNVTTVNSTTCTITVNATDPLQVKGPPLNSSNMVCEVEIRTREMRTSNKVDCNTLLRYSRMPEPKSENVILPERQQLRKLLDSPPWWMSLFIAV